MHFMLSQFVNKWTVSDITNEEQTGEWNWKYIESNWIFPEMPISIN